MDPEVKIVKTELLIEEDHPFRKLTYNLDFPGGVSLKKSEEIYERGEAVTALLYNPESQNVILTRQFRLPVFLNDCTSGMLIETCAGMVDDESPEDAIKREIQEETGYHIPDVVKLYEAYSSPGSIIELLHFFVARYSPDMKVGAGGGLKKENEHVEILEMPFSEALNLLENGKLRDAKTILLMQYLRMSGLMGKQP